MQDPFEEIKDVIFQLASPGSPDAQRNAVYKYYAPNAGFRHPLSHVDPGILSREYILGIYQWHRILSPHGSIHLDSISYDKLHNTLSLDVVQRFHLFFLPIEPCSCRFLMRLTLKEERGVHLIVMQEDFFHPDELVALIFPPIAPFFRFSLRAFGTASNICAKTAQVFGYWRPSTTGLAGENEYEEMKNEATNGRQEAHFTHRAPQEKDGNASHEGNNMNKRLKKDRKKGNVANDGLSETKTPHPCGNLPSNTET